MRAPLDRRLRLQRRLTKWADRSLGGRRRRDGEWGVRGHGVTLDPQALVVTAGNQFTTVQPTVSNILECEMIIKSNS